MITKTNCELNNERSKSPTFKISVASNEALLLKALAHLHIRGIIAVSVLCGLIAHRKLNEHALQMCTDAILIYLRLLIGPISEQRFQLRFNAHFTTVDCVYYVVYDCEYPRH